MVDVERFYVSRQSEGVQLRWRKNCQIEFIKEHCIIQTWFNISAEGIVYLICTFTSSTFCGAVHQKLLLTIYWKKWSNNAQTMVVIHWIWRILMRYDVSFVYAIIAVYSHPFRYLLRPIEPIASDEEGDTKNRGVNVEKYNSPFKNIWSLYQHLIKLKIHFLYYLSSIRSLQ